MDDLDRVVKGSCYCGEARPRWLCASAEGRGAARSARLTLYKTMNNVGHH